MVETIRKFLCILSFMVTVFSVTIFFPGEENVYATSLEKEYKLQAAFILNFAKFSSWPPSSDNKEFFTILFLGDEAVHEVFKSLGSRKISGKKIKLVHAKNNKDGENPQLIFISKSYNKDVKTVLSNYTDKPVLTVSDKTAFAQSGGIIEFVNINNRLGFIINLTQAKTSGITLNSSLLNLAVKVM